MTLLFTLSLRFSIFLSELPPITHSTTSVKKKKKKKKNKSEDSDKHGDLFAPLICPKGDLNIYMRWCVHADS